MPTPGEHKTVRTQILEYAEAIGCTFVSLEEAEQHRASSPEGYGGTNGKSQSPECIRILSLLFDDQLHAKVREFIPHYAVAEGSLLGQFRHLHTVIYGNWEFVEHLRNRANSSTTRRSASTTISKTPSALSLTNW